MSYNPFSLEEKTILITGASSGIGKATAIECAKLGARIIITGRNKERLSETLSIVSEFSENSLSIPCNLENPEELKNLVESLPALDGLVNNAGITKILPCSFLSEEKVSDVFNVNTVAPIVLFSRLLKKKKIKENSSVVFVSSINGVTIGGIGQSIYSASKAGLTGFVKTAALEVAPKKIRVNAICPGMTETDFLKTGAISDEQFKEDMKNYPLGRYATVQEIALSIVYLLSNASSFVTGTNIIVDGGFSIR